MQFDSKLHIFRIKTPVCALIQSTCQSVLIMDAWKRRCVTLYHIKMKLDRQLITFLLLTNIALWIVNRVKNNQAFSHPNQKYHHSHDDASGGLLQISIRGLFL